MRAKIEPRYRQNGPVDYLNRNPVKNPPKLLDWADTFCADSKAPSPGRETVLFAVQKFRFHEPLPAEGTGAVTSVRVTPLEKVRLLRMVEKSLDMLR